MGAFLLIIAVTAGEFAVVDDFASMEACRAAHTDMKAVIGKRADEYRCVSTEQFTRALVYMGKTRYREDMADGVLP